jgi:ORF6N domain
MGGEKAIKTVPPVDALILTVRDRRVILDSDLAGIYGVTTSALNQAVSRNLSRFPIDFAFQLKRQELGALISQTVISKSGRGGRTKLPWVFTEHGAIMLASVLNSPVAVEASVRVVRAFIYFREQLAANRELARKVAELEGHVGRHDQAIRELFEAIHQLLEPPAGTQRPEIGFHVRETAPPYRIRRRRRY